MATPDKNKSEQTLSVESRLKSLYELQTILSQIDRIRTVRGELPNEVKDLEDEVQGLNTRIEKFRHEIEEFRKKTVAEKEKINESRSKIEKYKSQLDNVRNNREFDLLSKEIEFQTLEIELCEKHINEYGTMDYLEAAALTKKIKPKFVIPTHYGSIVGDEESGILFKELIDEKETKCELYI